MIGVSAYAYAATVAIGLLVVALCAFVYRSERARRLTEARLRRTIRATGVGPWERDVATGDYWLAPEWLEIMGYAPGELRATAQGLTSIVHPDDVDAQREAVKRCVEQGLPYDVEFRARARSGEYPWFHSRGLPEFDTAGHVVRIAGAIENVTERHRSRAALIEAQRVAAQASRAKGEFLAEMSHEIRTPMNGVLGMAELLLGTRLDPEQRDCVRTIQVSANALLMLVNDVLDLSKIEAGKLELFAKPTDLREIVADVARLLATQALAKGLDLTTHIDASLPAQVLGDSLRVRQILINLTGNAIKFTERGEVAIRIHCIESEGDRTSIRCEVRDSGPGISPAQQEKLFRAYSQLENAELRNEGGTGLGLSIVRRLASLMGGEAGVVSQQGAGSTFWFTATFAAVESATIEPTDSARDEPAHRSLGLRTFRVLIADDNVVNQKVACMMLSRLSVDVVVVDNGDEAVEAWKRGAFDLILMDCQMPGLDGFGATRAIREQEPFGTRIPIVALTANAMKGDEAECLNAGMDGHLTKPITLDALSACLAQWGGGEMAAVDTNENAEARSALR